MGFLHYLSTSLSSVGNNMLHFLIWIYSSRSQISYQLQCCHWLCRTIAHSVQHAWPLSTRQRLDSWPEHLYIRYFLLCTWPQYYCTCILSFYRRTTKNATSHLLSGDDSVRNMLYNLGRGSRVRIQPLTYICRSFGQLFVNLFTPFTSSWQ